MPWRAAALTAAREGVRLPFRSTVAAIRLIGQLRTAATFTFTRLLAVSNQPLNVVVWQPYRTTAFLLQRPKTGIPVRCGSPQALISAPTAVQLALARKAYATPSVAYAGNSNPLCHI